MARPYSQKFLMELFANEKDTLGIKIGRLCVKGNLHTSHVSKVFEVSRVTIHSWFRGAVMRKKHHATAEAFIRLVEKDLEAKTLPAANSSVSKWYIESMLGKSI